MTHVTWLLVHVLCLMFGMSSGKEGMPIPEDEEEYTNANVEDENWNATNKKIKDEGTACC